MPTRTFLSYDPEAPWLLPLRSLLYSKAQRNFTDLVARDATGAWRISAHLHHT
ncbi:MAG: hypothetical protein JSS39_16045 [Nitrospira sp.]|nr:hypothetical protein [Nitrospira sp.]